MGERHRPLLVVMGVVLPAECDVGVSKIDQPVVGDRNPMRVPGQIVQNVFGTAEGAFAHTTQSFPKQLARKGFAFHRKFVSSLIRVTC